MMKRDQRSTNDIPDVKADVAALVRVRKRLSFAARFSCADGPVVSVMHETPAFTI